MAQKIKRDYLIDSLRGFMLVIMTLDHTPLSTFRLTYSTFGFFDAAMGFVFLSSYLFGLVYSRYTESPRFLLKKTYKRIFSIYIYHVISFLIIILIGIVGLNVFNVRLLDSQYYDVFNSYERIVKFLFLLEQPPFFDILPLYIFLLFFSPFILLGMSKGYSKQILTVSFIIWFVFQLKVVQSVYSNFLLELDLNMGYFNLFAWQFLFVTGLFMGYNKFHGKQIIRYNKIWARIVFMVAVFIFLIRQYGEYAQWEVVLRLLKNRVYLSFPSLVSFFLVIFLIGGVSKNVNIKKTNYFAFLGKYSIDVFVFHLLLILPLRQAANFISSLFKVEQIVIVIVIVICLAIPALIRAMPKSSIKSRKEDVIKNLRLISTLPKDAVVLFSYIKDKTIKLWQ